MSNLKKLRGLKAKKPLEVTEKEEKAESKGQINKERFAGVKQIPESVVLEADEKINRMLEDMEFRGKKSEFIKQFTIDFNPEKAAARAGYKSPKYGFKLIKLREVLNAIDAILATHEANALITPEFLQGQMGIYATSNIANYFDGQGNFKSFDEITRAQASCIQSFHKKYDKEGRPEYKISLYDAMKANENMGRVYQLYDKPTEDPSEFNDMTQDELMTWLADNLPEDMVKKLVGDK